MNDLMFGGFGSMGPMIPTPVGSPAFPVGSVGVAPTSGQLGGLGTGVTSGAPNPMVPATGGPANPIMPSAPNPLGGMGGFFRNPDGSMNTQNIGMMAGGLQALGGMWNTFQQTRLARQSMDQQREAWETNLANQEKTYNTSLEDKIRSRYAAEGRSSRDADDYLKKHQL